MPPLARDGVTAGDLRAFHNGNWKVGVSTSISIALSDSRVTIGGEGIDISSTLAALESTGGGNAGTSTASAAVGAGLSEACTKQRSSALDELESIDDCVTDACEPTESGMSMSMGVKPVVSIVKPGSKYAGCSVTSGGEVKLGSVTNGVGASTPYNPNRSPLPWLGELSVLEGASAGGLTICEGREVTLAATGN